MTVSPAPCFPAALVYLSCLRCFLMAALMASAGLPPTPAAVKLGSSPSASSFFRVWTCFLPAFAFSSVPLGSCCSIFFFFSRFYSCWSIWNYSSMNRSWIFKALVFKPTILPINFMDTNSKGIAACTYLSL